MTKDNKTPVLVCSDFPLFTEKIIVDCSSWAAVDKYSRDGDLLHADLVSAILAAVENTLQAHGFKTKRRQDEKTPCHVRIFVKR